MPNLACLVIDDDPIAATWLLELLRSRGHVAILGSCLKLAESHLATGGFARIIIDRRLPDGDGLQWLQQYSQPLPWPVLLTSGDDLSATALPGGVVFLRKPVDPGPLLAWLETGAGAPAMPADGRESDAQTTELPVLSDQPALTRLGGRIETLQALRLMLLKELQTAESWISTLPQSEALATSLSNLHRLSAACALTGCDRLGQASGELESQLRAGHGISRGQQCDIEAILTLTRSELEHRASAAISRST